MYINASAGKDRKKDLRNNCYSLKLTATTDEEEHWLSQLRLYIMGSIDGLPCVPGTHKFTTKRAGGSPDVADSYERVRYCEVCGWEG